VEWVEAEGGLLLVTAKARQIIGQQIIKIKE